MDSDDDDINEDEIGKKMRSSSSSKSNKKKRKKNQKLNNVFDAIEELESEDIKASKKRQKVTTANIQRAKAAQSQTKIYNHIQSILTRRVLLVAIFSGQAVCVVETDLDAIPVNATLAQGAFPGNG